MSYSRIHIDQLEIGMYVETIESSSSSCPIKQAGVVRSEAIIMALKQYNVEYVTINENGVEASPCQDNFEQPSTTLSIEKRLKDIDLASRVSKILNLAERAKEQLKYLCSYIVHIGEKDFATLEYTASEINRVLSEDPAPTMLMIKLHDGQPDVYDHSINSGFLMGLFSQEMGFELGICHELIIAGMLHDIGLTTVPRKILENRNSLSKAETFILNGHIALGEEVLRAQYKNISDICMSCILHHHERLDGSGYPLGLIKDDISFWGKILAIVDTYETLTSSRYSSDKKTNNQALAILLSESNNLFDASLTAIFSQFIGAFPLGSFVLCEESHHQVIGLVIEENIPIPLEPVIVVFYDIKEERHIAPFRCDLTHTDEKLTLQRAVNIENYVSGINPKQLISKLCNLI